MDRREFLNVSAATALSAALPKGAAAVPAAQPEAPPTNAPWRTFDVVTEVEIWPQDVPAKVWLPSPIYGDTDYQRAVDTRWTGNPSATGIYRDPRYGAPAFFAQWDDRGLLQSAELPVPDERARGDGLNRDGAATVRSLAELFRGRPAGARLLREYQLA